MEEEEKKEGKKRRRHIVAGVVWMLILFFLAFAVVTFPEGWGPRTVRAAALKVLPHGEGVENEIDIRRISLSGVTFGEVSLAGMPSMPSFTSAEVKWTFRGLLAKKIDAVQVLGFSVKPEYKVENFAMPSLGSAGKKKVAKDPLQGWTFDSALVNVPFVEFAPLLPANVREMLRTTNGEVTLNVSHDGTSYTGTVEGALFGGDLTGRIGYSQEDASGKFVLTYSPVLKSKTIPLPGDIVADVAFAVTSDNGYGLKADGSLGIERTVWQTTVAADLSSDGLDLSVRQPLTDVSEKDPLLVTAMALAPLPPNITNITAQAAMSATFLLGVTNGLPTWSASARLSDGEASAFVSGTPMGVSGIRARAAVEGIGPHFDIMPIPVSFTNAFFAAVPIQKGFLTIIADQESLLISEASAGFCGGNLCLYSLYLSFKRLSAGFTIFLDDIQVADLLHLVPQLRDSTATGALHGRIPLYLMDNGGQIRLRDSFLYTPPGATGSIHIGDPELIFTLFANTGIPEEESRLLAKALQNLDYDVLRFDLSQPRGMGDGRLAIKLKGESKDGKIVTPVDLNLNINGAIQKVLNYGLKSAKMKGK